MNMKNMITHLKDSPFVKYLDYKSFCLSLLLQTCMNQNNTKAKVGVDLQRTFILILSTMVYIEIHTYNSLNFHCCL